MSRIALILPFWMLSIALVACAPSGTPSASNQSSGSGAQGSRAPRAVARDGVDPDDLEGSRQRLEAERDRKPRSVDARVALGDTYYRIARDALDRNQDEGRYLKFLELSIEEFVAAVELDPRDERPHFYLAMMDAYRGDLPKALRGFNNARRLKPAGTAYTNIAEIYIYMDRIRQAHEWNDLGLRKRAPYSAVQFNEMLIAWREGNLREARKIFGELKRNDPETIRNINVARLPEEPRQFEDFAGYCCGSPACGPFMKEPCQSLQLEVVSEQRSEDAVLKELRLEIEKNKRLKKVYEQRKELEIDVEQSPPAR